MFKTLKVMAAVGVMALGASAAHADPITLYVSFDGTNYSTLMTTATGFGSYNNVVTNGNFSYNVQFSATGSGTSPFAFTEPSFDTQSITVSSSSGGVIYLASSSLLLAPLTAQSAFVSAAGLTSGYSIGERYRIDFGTIGGSINATISERGVVPEPMSLALLGTGLVGFGFIRRLKGKSA